MNQNVFDEVKQKQIKFFAIHLPCTDSFKMEMMIRYKEGHSTSETKYFKFQECKLNTILPGFEDLKLFWLPLTIAELIKRREKAQYLDIDGTLKQIEAYGVRVSNGISYYYERIQCSRKLISAENIFIFDLIILKNDILPCGKSVAGFLEQILCFSVAITETNNYTLLKEFIEQHEGKFRETGPIGDQQFQKFYTSIEKLLEKKVMHSKEIDIDILHTLTCAFGLLPEKETSVLNYQNNKLDIMLQGFENRLDQFIGLGTDPKHLQIDKKFIKGLSLLFIIEEHTRRTSNWIKLLQFLKSNPLMHKRFSELVKAFLERGHTLKISIRMENFKKLQDIVENLLINYPHSLILAPSIPDFVRLAKEYISQRIKSIEDLAGPGPRISTEYARNQELILNDSVEELKKHFQSYLDKSKGPNKECSLEMIAEFLRELYQNPYSITQVFMERSFRDSLCFSIENSKYPDERSLELLHKILVKYYDEFLLFRVKRSTVLNSILNQVRGEDSQNLLGFHVKFFEFFMANGTLSFDEFCKILKKFIKNIGKTDPLLCYLDSLCFLFKESDIDANKKKDHFVTEIVKNMNPEAFDLKLIHILEDVKSPQLLAYFKSSIQQDIRINSLNYLSTKNYFNPITRLQNVFNIFPDNALVQELIHFCIAQIPQFKREQVLIQLLKEPHELTLVYMVLTDPVFQNTKLYDGLNNICRSIIEDIQKLDLELKWILYSKRAPTAILYKQFNIIIDKNNIMQKDSPDQKLDIESSLTNYYRIWEEKVNAIKILQDFIHKLCSNAIDAPQYLEKLKQIWENQDDKKLSDIISPRELDTFLPFMNKLQPFAKSESFATFRKKRVDNGQALTCEEEAQKAESALTDFKADLLGLINNPETSFNKISQFFLEVQDLKTERQILLSLVNEEKKQYFFRVLQVLQDQGNVRRICRGLSVCINVFNLSCSFEDTIKTGCKLGLNDPIKLFSEIDEAIKGYLTPLDDASFCEIIQEFETAQKLLEFTVSITQKSEIDFMTEAVNDYDEGHISTQIIFDFSNVWTLISTLNIRAYDKALRVFIEEMSLLCEKKSDICPNLKASKKNFSGIQALHSDLHNKDKFKKNQIFNIMSKSFVRILYEQKNFDAVVDCQTELDHKIFTQSFKSSEILELRDRALLVVFTEQNKLNNAEAQKYKSEEVQQFQDFCYFVDIIQQVIQLLIKLKMHGFPDLTSFQDNCHVPILRANYVCNQAKFPSLEGLKFLLSETFDEWGDLVIESYKKYYALTYLKGKDFWKIEKTLINWDSDLIGQVKSFQKGVLLLEYTGKKGSRVNLNIQETPQKRLISIGEALNNLENTSQENRSVNLTENYTFYLVEVDEKSLVRGLLSVYSGNIPLSSQVLFCKDSTTWSELAAFGFRCFYSPQANLFCLVQPEILSFSLRDQFLKLLRDLKNNHPDRKYKLGFVTTNMATTLDNALENRSQTKIFKNTEILDDSKLERILMSSAANCTIVTSRITGLGKSYWIKSQIRSPQEKLVKVPISGPVDPHELGKRLLNYSTQEKLVLWFTIGSIKESDKPLLNNILFSLIAIKSFHDSRNVVRIPKDCRMFIELDSSGFENLKKDMEILRNIPPDKHIDFMTWNNLDYTSKKIQFVCYYLLALEDESLGTRDLREEDLENKTISKKDCEDMLKIPLVVRRDPAEQEYMSYTQLNIYVEILYSLLKAFSENNFFSYNIFLQNNSTSGSFSEERGAYSGLRQWAANLMSSFYKATIGNFMRKRSDSNQLGKEVMIKMRMTLVKTLTMVAQYFTTKSVQSVRSSQIKAANKPENFSIEKSAASIRDAVISWESFDPFIVIFTSDQVPVFIYKDQIPDSITKAIKSQTADSEVREEWLDNLFIDYKNCTQADLFERLVSLTNKIYASNVCLKCFRKYNMQLTFCGLCQAYVLQNNGDNLQEFISQIATESSKDYVLTPDNFLKMILIYMRVKQKIPVIIMGETGCGKTSLIRYLSTRILDCEFRPFQIHAGINHEKIIANMNKFKKDAKETGKDLWVFFDEFNTTDSIGLIKEIICERTMLGEKLPENMVFLAACNPWRLKTEKLLDENIGIHKRHLASKTDKYKLLYTVYPLPETMVNFVWDYGFLDFETEREYIKAMLSSVNILKGRERLENFMVKLICAAQQWFKKREDVSSVSLRDVSRYKILFEWFSNSLISRNSCSYEDTTVWRDQEILYKDAMILAFLHCYYLRIVSHKKRSGFLQDFKLVFAEIGLQINEVEFLLKREEMDFVKRMGELPKGIALNQALRENIFALIVCIFTKIPIFICGKPGCSKSLAIQLVFESFKGKDSTDPYFKTLPELIPVAYQGSEYCTSDSVLAVFNRAEKYLSVTDKNKQILPVIVLDEIGLAEISENNPLKIIHNKLEVENCTVSFVGISNWRLDASKMNRALYLARPEPSISELILTGEEIWKSFGKNIPLRKDVINTLAHVYLAFTQTSEVNQADYIFGLRDYYCLVKGIIGDLNVMQGFDENTLFYIVKNNLRKNFSGLKDEYNTLWEKFCYLIENPEMVKMIRDVSTLDLIRSNLNSINTRYLMLITEDDSISEFIEEILTREQARTVVKLIGSQMPEDLKNESYGYKMLSDIILHLEKGHTLIFKKMDHLYSSLYDLFNQNFAWSGNKRYCRVALGAMHNPRCFVHENLHCIVLMNEKELKNADLPFLNRFEKYKVSIDDIISFDENLLFNELKQWVASFTRWKNTDSFIKPNMLFVNYSPDYLRTLILDAKKNLRQGQENYETRLLELCKQELIQTATFDFPVVVSKNLALVEYLKLYYPDNENSCKEHSFNAYCEKIFEKKMLNNKSVVYTYTQVSEDVLYSTDRPVLEFKLSSFRSENEIQEQLRQIYLIKQALLCFRVEFNAGTSHLPFLKNLLSNFANNLEPSQNIHIMIIIHLKRCDICDGKVQIDTLFQGWKSFMFDNLNTGVIAQKEQVLQGSFNSLISLNIIPDINNTLKAGVDKCLSKIKYDLARDEQRKINKRRNQLLEKLNNSENFWDLLKEKVVEVAQDLNDEHLEFHDWREYILENEWVRSKATSSIHAMGLGISYYYNACLLRILYALEQNWLLDSYFKAGSNSFLLELWSKKFKEMQIMKDEGSQGQSLCINKIVNMVFPFSLYEWKQIKQIQNEAEEFKDRKNPDLLKRIFYDKLLEKSFFQDDLLKILRSNDLFEKYMKDQLRLFLINSKIDLEVDIAISILEKMFPNNCEAQLAYFVSHPKELLLIYEPLEIMLAKENNRAGLYKALSKTYNLEQDSNDYIYNSDPETLPNRSLLFKNGRYYSLDREKALEIIKNNSNLNDLTLDGSVTNQTSFVRLLFENSIEKICYSSSISKFITLKEAISGFRTIQAKIKKSGFTPANSTLFQPWVDLLEFINESDQDPNKRYEVIANRIRENGQRNPFLSLDIIDGLLTDLRMSMKNSLQEDEKTTRLLKLQAQFYDNLLSVDSERFDEVLIRINSTPTMWKYSSNIIDMLDRKTDFLKSIIQDNGNIRNLERNKNLVRLGRLLSNMPKKIVLMLLNKTVSILHSYYLTKQGFVLENEGNFTGNLERYKTLYQQNPSSDRKDIQFLGLIVWLKAYLHLYVKDLLGDDQGHGVFKIVDDALGSDACFSTLNLYILKIMKHEHGKSLDDIRKIAMKKNICSFRDMIKEDPSPRKVIPLLPFPDQEYAIPFKEIDEILNKLYSLDNRHTEKFLAKCKEVQTNYIIGICIYSWFIRLYQNYNNEEFQVNQEFINLLQEEKTKKELTERLGKTGVSLIFQMLNNFEPGSFLHLQTNSTITEVYQKVTILNVLACFLAQQFTNSTFSSILFAKQDFPEDIMTHFSQRCFFGQIKKNKIIHDMKLLKEEIQKRRTKVSTHLRYIYKCSPECDYLFLFQKSGKPRERGECPLCKKLIGADLKTETLAIRSGDVTQQEIKTFDQGLEFIDKKIEAFKRNTKFGYYVNPPEENNLDDKKDNLDPLTSRLLHFIIHAVLFGLIELNLISSLEAQSLVTTQYNCSNNPREYFKEHVLQDYKMLIKQTGSNDVQVWVYSIILSLRNLVHQTTILNDEISLLEFEAAFKHDFMKDNRVDVLSQAYNHLYNAYINSDNKYDIMSDIKEDNTQNPKGHSFFEFFSHLSFSSLEDFKHKFDISVNENSQYPLLKYFLTNQKELFSLCSLTVIVDFIRLLIKRWDHQVSRKDAESKTLKDACDTEGLQKLLPGFIEELNSAICILPNSSRYPQSFRDSDRLTYFLTSKQSENREAESVVVAVMRGLSKIQNGMLYECNNIGLTFEDFMLYEKENMILVQTLQKDDIIDLREADVINHIERAGYIHNFKFGFGRDIIYDFRVIENRLYQCVNRKRVLNTEKFIPIHYQFELLPDDKENNPIILKIQAKNAQEKLDQKGLYQNLIADLQSNQIMEYLGLFDYIFTYLCNVKGDPNQTIEDFCKLEMMQNSMTLNQKLFENSPFLRTKLKYIVGLYELIEEAAFKSSLQSNLRPELMEDNPEIVNLFMKATINNSALSSNSIFKSSQALSQALIKLIMRVAIPRKDLERNIGQYLGRPDLWSSGINENEFKKLELSDYIKLKHSYVIYKSLLKIREPLSEQPIIYCNQEQENDNDYSSINEEDYFENWRNQY